MIAIITGASSGIGREFAYQIDNLDYDEIWLIARRYERLVEVKNNLKTKTKILALDLLEEESFLKITTELDFSNDKVGLLVNAAGIGYNDYFENLSLEKSKRTIDLNILAATQMIKVILPFMAKDSVIINVASVAGFIPQPKFATYAASKSYLISLSRALSREFRDRKIHLATLCPNPVNTEFGANNDSGIKKLATEDINKLVSKTLKQAKYKDVITVHPSAKFMLVISKIIPHSFIMWLEKIFGLY
ncbi:SDR family NAD(P)-dependent oxidoreductase [Anaerococcus cruorum]|uniref:SDR family NAD(P)-dependent oxidoreductase n=1 Tax=Anaerococcus sp. WGS1529 TaxID=3366812 RepID=UPI00372D6EE0